MKRKESIVTNSARGKLISLSFVAAAAAACGGGGGGGDGTIAGIDGTGSPSPTPSAATISVGTITAFGSVFVNGVRFETNSTQFEIDGESGTQDDLAVGDVVLVVGSLDDNDSAFGTADSIVFDDAVEGPVNSVDVAGSALLVLGQTVRISANTSFDDSFVNPSLAGIAPGDIVEVSGLRTSDGSIEATRIEPKPAGLEFETTGIVANLDSVAMTFNINALVVDYSAAMLNDFDGGSIADGDLVEAKGMILGADDELIATRVEFKGADVIPDAGDRVEIEGFVTRFATATDFDVSGLPVMTNSSTVFEGGSAADLGLDIKLEAEGTIDSNGVLVATKIDIRRGSAVRLVALIDSVDTSGELFVALGITIRADELTRIEDKSDMDVEPFSVGDLVAGDYIEVRGMEFPVGSGEILASLIEREDPDTETELQGFVATTGQPSFEILGVTITTNGATQFEDAGENVISSAQFFSALAPGSLVKASGIEVADQAITADEVEFENE
jgi:hypothetical protein